MQCKGNRDYRISRS